MQNDLIHSDLADLRNLGFTTIYWLKLIGIRSPQALYRMGAPEAVTRMQRRGFKATKCTLYALHGALVGINWKDLDSEVKGTLVGEFEALQESLTAA